MNIDPVRSIAAVNNDDNDENQANSFPNDIVGQHHEQLANVQHSTGDSIAVQPLIGDNQVLCEEAAFDLFYSGGSETSSGDNNQIVSNPVTTDVNSSRNWEFERRRLEGDRSISNANSLGTSSRESPNNLSSREDETNKENMNGSRAPNSMPELIPLTQPNLAQDPFGFVRYHRALQQRNLAKNSYE